MFVMFLFAVCFYYIPRLNCFKSVCPSLTVCLSDCMGLAVSDNINFDLVCVTLTWCDLDFDPCDAGMGPHGDVALGKHSHLVIKKIKFHFLSTD